MSVTSYKQLLLKARPEGNIKDSDFELVSLAIIVIMSLADVM